MMYELTIHTKNDTYNFAAYDYKYEYDYDIDEPVLYLYDSEGTLAGAVTGVKAFFAREVKE